jgi:hypothetical protein
MKKGLEKTNRTKHFSNLYAIELSLDVRSTFCAQKFEQFFFQQLAILNDKRSKVPRSKDGLAGTNTIRYFSSLYSIAVN